MNKKQEPNEILKNVKNYSSEELSVKTEEMTEGMLKSNILYRVYSIANSASLVSVACSIPLSFAYLFVPSILTLGVGTIGFIATNKLKKKYATKTCEYGMATEKCMEELLERMPEENIGDIFPELA